MLRRTALPRGSKPLRRTRMRTIRDLEAEAAWDAFRREVYARDGFQCVCCGTEAPIEATHCHHRVLRSRGGRDIHEHCVTLLAGHHAAVHVNPSWSTARGLMVPGRVDPATWPVLRRFQFGELWSIPMAVEAEWDGPGWWTWTPVPPDADQHDEPAPWASA